MAQIIKNETLIRIKEIMKNAKRDKFGHFVKGDPALSKKSMILGLAQKGRKNTWGDKISIALKGRKLSLSHIQKLKKTAIKLGCTNTGKTHFKKGERLGNENTNWKGGASKTKEYRNYYKNFYKLRLRNAKGSHTLREWGALKEKYNWICPLCQRKEPEIKLTRDHIVPLSKGGESNIENIQPLCMNCNCQKHTKIIRTRQLCQQY
jgi:hypothetical protein